MPRVYEVIAEDLGTVLATRYASTAADGKATKNELVERLELKKTAVTVEQIEIPAAKAEFLEWLNGKMEKFDKPNDAE